MPPTRKMLAFVMALAAATLALDQGSKAWAHGLPPYPRPVIAGFWDWQLAMNPGAAFSVWTGAGDTGARIGLSVIALLALAGIAVAIWRSAPEQRLRRTALAIIIGGVAGNLIDRVRFGAVTDFVSWHVHGHYWPVFNVADVALLVGALLLVADTARRPAPGPALTTA